MIGQLLRPGATLALQDFDRVVEIVDRVEEVLRLLGEQGGALIQAQEIEDVSFQLVATGCQRAEGGLIKALLLRELFDGLRAKLCQEVFKPVCAAWMWLLS